jgi:starvation-inducible outer membrane lipoprotein
MKKFLLITTILFLTGCASLPSVLKNDLNACFEAQKSMSRDQTMRDIAVLEMAKTANDQTKMAAIAQINNRSQQNLVCK